MTGRTISHYEILDKLGEGGMGEVFKARDLRLNRLAAIKVLPADKMADQNRKARFVQEAQTASSLNHPNIVTIYGIDRDNDIDFIAMEYVAGRSLDQVVARRGLKLADTLKYSIQIADALAAAHAAGVVHRDLKPANVMITESGVVKILDFGLAKLAAPQGAPAEGATRTIHVEEPLTEQGTVLGTVSYMSPEQAEGKHVDARSDIFSFGSVLFEMVTGKRAFQGDSKMSTISSILRDEPKLGISSGSDPVPRDLEKILARCLRKDVSRRFQHMDDVKIALQELKEESDSGSLFVREVPNRKSRRVPWALAALGAVLACALAGALLWRSRPAVSKGLKLRQLTQDSGFTGYPAISPDGKLIAYASDRAGNAGLDIWVQQLSRGAQPIRLTKDPADEYHPSFSPDGGQIVFSSQREGGGIYVIPSLGGEERLVMRGDFINPRFSPDGQWIATSNFGTFTGKTFVIPAAGGAPRSISDKLYHANFRAWSPDGKKVLVGGLKEMGGDYDWFVLPLDGGSVIKSGAAAVLQTINANTDRVFEWLNGRVLYADGNLWRMNLPVATGKVTGEPERITTGSSYERNARAIPAASANVGQWRIVFGSGQISSNLWDLSINLNAAGAVGEARKLIADAVGRESPSLSANGTRLVYIARNLDSFSLRVRNIPTGSEKTLLEQTTNLRAKISPDGSTVAYNPKDNDETENTVLLLSTAGGESRKLCVTCGMIYDWTPDGRRIVFRSGNPMKFSSVDAASGQQQVVLADPHYPIHAVVFSPDQRWIAMHYAPDPGAPRAIYLSPVHDGHVADKREWIPVMDRPGRQTRPWWSPDGNVLYFLSTSGGKQEIWAQRLQPETKHPAGEPFRIYGPPGERYSISTGTWFGPGIGPKNLIFPMREETGNIWIAE